MLTELTVIARGGGGTGWCGCEQSAEQRSLWGRDSRAPLKMPVAKLLLF